jgi:hypothetical protein
MVRAVLGNGCPSALTWHPFRFPSRHSSALATLQATSKKLTTAAWTEAIAIHWMSDANAKGV